MCSTCHSLSLSLKSFTPSHSFTVLSVMSSSTSQHSPKDLDGLEKPGLPTHCSDDQTPEPSCPQPDTKAVLSSEDIQARRKTYLPGYEESTQPPTEALRRPYTHDLQPLQAYTQDAQSLEAARPQRRPYLSARMHVPAYLPLGMLLIILLSGSLNVLLTALALSAAPHGPGTITVSPHIEVHAAAPGIPTAAVPAAITGSASRSAPLSIALPPSARAPSSAAPAVTVTAPAPTSVTVVTETPSRPVVTETVLSTTVVPPAPPAAVTVTTVVPPSAA